MIERHCAALCIFCYKHYAKRAAQADKPAPRRAWEGSVMSWVPQGRGRKHIARWVRSTARRRRRANARGRAGAHGHRVRLRPERNVAVAEHIAQDAAPADRDARGGADRRVHPARDRALRRRAVAAAAAAAVEGRGGAERRTCERRANAVRSVAHASGGLARGATLKRTAGFPD